MRSRPSASIRFYEGRGCQTVVGGVFEIDLHRGRRADAPPISGVGVGGRMRWRYDLTRFRLGSKLAFEYVRAYRSDAASIRVARGCGEHLIRSS
jgi:hypothetical protein